MGSVYLRRHQQNRRFCTYNHFVVQRIILIVCSNHVQEFPVAVFVKCKWINHQMNTPLYCLGSLSENCVIYSFIHFKYDNVMICY